MKPPELRIVRREVYISPTFLRSGRMSTVDFLQIKEDGEWNDIPVKYESIVIDDQNEKALGNY